MTTLFVSVPCYGAQVLEAFAGSFIHLAELCRAKNIQLCFDTTENESLIPRARNVSMGRFMKKSTANYFMFIDADIHFDPNSVIRLLESGHDFTCAAYPKKCIMWEDASKCIKEGDTRPPELMSSSLVMNFKRGNATQRVTNGFVEVLDGATGFMLVKREVVEKMYAHYKEELFCINDHQNADFKDYVALFDCFIDPDNNRYLSEDYAFCRRWQQMGGKIFADSRATLGHVGNLVFNGRLKDRITNITNDAPGGSGNKKPVNVC